MKGKMKNLLCAGAVAALLVWTVHTILKEQSPGQLAAALLPVFLLALFSSSREPP